MNIIVSQEIEQVCPRFVGAAVEAQGFPQKAPGFGQKTPGFGQKAPGYEQDSVVVFYLLPRKPNSLLILVNILKN